jgi:hypothetical protein
MPVWVYYVPVAVVFVVAMVIAIGAVIRNVRQFSSVTAADPFLTSGTPGTARVLSADWTGAVINLEYVCRIGLRVQIPGRQTYDVNIEQRVDPVRMAALQPGTTVAVRVDPADPHSVRIDFSQPTQAPGAESHGAPPTAAALAQAYGQSPDSTQTASAADLLASGQRVRGVLKSFADTGSTPRSLGKTPSRPEFLDDPLYVFDVDLQFPNLAPVEGQAVQRVPRARVPNLAIGLELACVVDAADPTHIFVVDWGDITH